VGEQDWVMEEYEDEGGLLRWSVTAIAEFLNAEGDDGLCAARDAVAQQEVQTNQK
jgi:hypothetical protein